MLIKDNGRYLSMNGFIKCKQIRLGIFVLPIIRGSYVFGNFENGVAVKIFRRDHSQPTPLLIELNFKPCLSI